MKKQHADSFPTKATTATRSKFSFVAFARHLYQFASLVLILEIDFEFYAKSFRIHRAFLVCPSF